MSVNEGVSTAFVSTFGHFVLQKNITTDLAISFWNYLFSFLELSTFSENKDKYLLKEGIYNYLKKST